MPHKLYNTFCGRCLLKVLTLPAISKMAGVFMDSALSKPYIKHFIKSSKIDMSDFKEENWSCFNEFFTRKLKDGKRKPVMQSNIMISPCDGYLSAYKITKNSEFVIKDSVYTIKELTQNPELETEYENGLCLIFRLTPADYHRYIYPDSGEKGENIFIRGILHTVRPVAFKKYPVFKTNSREYTILKTNNFGDIVFMEVGAMLVGKICNYHQEHRFERGDEKGKFEFGGSTIIMLMKKDILKPDDEVEEILDTGEEIKIRLGERIGIRI